MGLTIIRTKVEKAKIYLGDCLQVMQGFPSDSVDSIVTDPPYGLSFMGKDWDHGVPGEHFWREALRVAKPGAYLLAFGGTRTFHRIACAIEDAGWEIRDTIMWVYGSGFPKSKSLDGEWQGWGTALKPAYEPIIVARKPLIGTVAANVLAHGTGAMNIDGCRVETLPRKTGTRPTSDESTGSGNSLVGSSKNRQAEYDQENKGRWPANLIHDGSDEVVALFPDTNPSKAANRGLMNTSRHGGLADAGKNNKEGTATMRGHDDAGGSAARFFYCAKASKKDRDEGCDGMEAKATASGNQAQAELKRGNLDHDQGSSGMNKVLLRKNTHPTVKPNALMRYLCRMVTPPGGIVLDPFTGSGSTGKAAVQEGFLFLGIERDPEYCAIAKARVQSIAGAVHADDPA